MIEARFVPIDKWPGKRTIARLDDRFRSNYISTLDLLESELRHLRAKDVVIQAGFTRGQLRNDGWPKAGERPKDPGIVISFESPKGPLSFPCDRYTDFQANMRAIALSLEALRAVDRYGVTRQAEQYRGWQQITAPGTSNGFQRRPRGRKVHRNQGMGPRRRRNHPQDTGKRPDRPGERFHVPQGSLSSSRRQTAPGLRRIPSRIRIAARCHEDHRGRTMSKKTKRDPQTPKEWQEAVDTAAGLRALHDVQLYGLIDGISDVNLKRCAYILEQGANRGIQPSKPALQLAVEMIRPINPEDLEP
jgi:hypothetical protein